MLFVIATQTEEDQEIQKEKHNPLRLRLFVPV